MKKTIWTRTALAVALCVMMLLAFGCKKETVVNVRIAALKGPTGMGLAYMMQENSGNYTIDLYDAPDAVTGKFISGEIDIAAVPINLASTLYNKTEGNAVLLCVNTLGVLYVLEIGDTVQSVQDLAGKTLYATGEGSTPEYIINYLLEQNGVTDTTVEYVGEHAALAAMVASGEAQLAMLPEPNVTAASLKNADARVALDLTEEWNKVAGTQLIQGCYIANRSFYEANPKAVEQFLSDYAASANKVNSEADAGSVIAAQGILPSETIASKAIPRCNIVCVTGDEMRSGVTAMLEVLYAANPKSVGGKLPDEAFFG